MKTHKLFTLFVLAFIAVFALAACGTPATEAPEPEGGDAGGGEETTTGGEETTTGGETASGDRVQIRWFVGLGAGSDEPTFAPQQAMVDAFNASQDEIELVLEIVDNDVAYDTLATQIAGGNAPDIVGPVGIRGRDSFKGAWLDLDPLIAATGYDLSDFDPAMVEFYRVQEEGQLGIPFAIFPSFVFVNKDLFDEAGLPYPPQEYGAPYIDENGEERVWDLETMREVAMKLTVDANGNDAFSPDFDPDNIVQFGWMNQFTDMRGVATMFGPGSLVDADGNAQMPDTWRDGLGWIHSAMWEDHFYPNDAYVNSEILGNNNPFQSGNLAMAHLHMWFAADWALGNVDFAWDTAVMPAYNDVVTAKMHADTFGILKASQHPEEAFTVLSYMLSAEVAPQLLQIYGGMPARLSLQGDYFETYGETVFPGQDINWQVVADSVAYADNPNHESWMPSFQETNDRYNEFFVVLSQEPDLDVDAEIDNLVADLQGIFDASSD